ncbi:uncharacterized protein BX663DRAFT_441902 [Cokeromyces recurvatus]|uniref:uncharacterized protein n=1 Tax=Cokeromyces recurvatus TaxID=90255 RepID=UPI00221F0C51|nr:uncharacterized protein BX663DRAFT_441902 [Cokeromyces recurvatus]KAI7898950.1 hypothetical protein BX663DRAFT_441902 [Cokeromyces recurvatus]
MEIAEWDRLWQVVHDTPDDFNSWEQLIRFTETMDGGLTKTSPPENITRLENVYDSFLAKFPLCFGYWKKYADWELTIRGDESAEKIFERGVVAIQNSIDLWNQYIDFKLSRSTSNEDMESLFERAANCIGLDFLAHSFWDKYLEFAETRLANPKRVLELLNRIVLIPMHQYARYYEKWRNIRANMNPSEALKPEQLEQFTKEIKEEKNITDPSEVQIALKEKFDNQTATVYKSTQDGTNKRWVYEAEIKRSYFHVKPLDRPQLQNWSKYLDFEESQQDKTRICALYERCLVPCAQYEEFWLRYGQWLTKNDLLEQAKHAYERASYIFLPRTCCTVKISLALILEEEGRIEEARKVFNGVLESMPTHVETILNYVHFERRQNPSAFESIIHTYIHSEQLNEASKAFFTVQYAKYLQQNNQADKAREIYSSSAKMYSQNKYFWMNYINFELSFFGKF